MFIKRKLKILRFFLTSSLLAGAVFVPVQSVQASFLSSLFGTQASAAATENANTDPQTLQNGLALAPQVSPNNTKDDPTYSSNCIDSSGTSLSASSSCGPAGSSDDSSNTDGSDSDQISFYSVHAGDTWAGIASMYGVTVNTILWANDKTKTDKLLVNDVLLIPPISGLEYEIKSGDTCSSIAKTYKVDMGDIINYNNLGVNCSIGIGDGIFIPNGVKPETSSSSVPAKSSSTSLAKNSQYFQPRPTNQNVSGYYIDPVPGYKLSQGIHDNNAVDLAIASGTPIHAAAAGIVILAQTGYNGGFGNLVIISHPNGTETLYAHQSKIATTTGAQVAQGQIIGYVGTTGRSTGPHLHFEVHGAHNPGADRSWAQ